MSEQQSFVSWFRSSAPYVHAHAGKTFVITFGGEALESPSFSNLVADLALLQGLGIRLVLAVGMRPQIERRLTQRGERARYGDSGLRITDKKALLAVKESAGAVRVELEARLSMGLPGSPMSGAKIRVASGNFVSARPIGVVDGIDYQHTGVVRRVDTAGIAQRLDAGAIVLLVPLGYSVTGEVFNLAADDVAASTAIALRADKLVCLVEGRGVVDARKRVLGELTPAEAARLLERPRLREDLKRPLAAAIHACRGGVRRAHLVGRRPDGAILLELFTRDGIGTMVSAETFEDVRLARPEDAAGIMDLLDPLQGAGMLVERTRERILDEISRFVVIERDGLIAGCAALVPFPDTDAAELAAVAIHPRYRDTGRGDALLHYIERSARTRGVRRLFVLTTRTVHWFRERGFEPAKVLELPPDRRSKLDRKRRSKVLVKNL